MTMYRTIETSIWTDPKIKQLTGESKLLFVYLITNSHSHVSGIYYLPKSLMDHETTIGSNRIDTLLNTLSDVGLACFDNENEVIWIKNMFRYQGKGEKNQRSAANQLATLHNSLLIKEYLEKYPEVKKHCNNTVLDRVSEFGTQEQEQEQNTEPETEEDPLNDYERKVNTYFNSKINGSMIHAWREVHQTIDIQAEISKAKAWLFANQHKKKIRFGSFLNNWMTNAANPPAWMKVEEEPDPNYFHENLSEEEQEQRRIFYEEQKQ